MKNILTTNEVKNKYEISVINRTFYMVEDAIRIIEDMELDIDTVIKVLNINVALKREVASDEQHDFYKVCAAKHSVDIIKYTKDNTFGFLDLMLSMVDNEQEDLKIRNENVAKAVVLSLFVRALEKDGAEPIDELQTSDTLNKSNMSNFDKKVGALASRLLIPKKEFNDKIGEIIYNTSYSEQRGEEQLLSVSLIRELLIEKLMKKYNVTEHMANVRLSVADLGDDKYDSLGQSIFSSFRCSYFDSESTKDVSKTKK